MVNEVPFSILRDHTPALSFSELVINRNGAVLFDSLTCRCNERHCRQSSYWYCFCISLVSTINVRYYNRSSSFHLLSILPFLRPVFFMLGHLRQPFAWDSRADSVESDGYLCSRWQIESKRHAEVLWWFLMPQSPIFLLQPVNLYPVSCIIIILCTTTMVGSTYHPTSLVLVPLIPYMFV